MTTVYRILGRRGARRRGDLHPAHAQRHSTMKMVKTRLLLLTLSKRLSLQDGLFLGPNNLAHKPKTRVRLR